MRCVISLLEAEERKTGGLRASLLTVEIVCVFEAREAQGCRRAIRRLPVTKHPLLPLLRARGACVMAKGRLHRLETMWSGRCGE